MKTGMRKYTFHSDFSQFTSLYQAIATVAGELGMSVKDQFRFGLCVSEAYTNAFLHGNEQNPDKCIQVCFSWNDNSVRIDIEDEGQTDASQIDIADASPVVAAEKQNGRGIGIIKNYADRLEIEQRKEGGIRVSIFWELTKRSTNSVTR